MFRTPNTYNAKRLTTADLLAFVKQHESSIMTVNVKPIDIVIDATMNPQQKNETSSIITNIIEQEFKKNIKKVGILKYNDNNVNMSLFTSILTALIPDFYKLDNKQQNDVVIHFISALDEFLDDKYGELHYKVYKIVKSEISAILQTYKITNIIYKLISDYFCINIFIIDNQENVLYVVDRPEIHNKSICLILHNKTCYEPIKYDKEYFLPNEFFSYLSNIAKRLHPIGNSYSDKEVAKIDKKYDNTDLNKYKFGKVNIPLSLQEKSILALIREKPIPKEVQEEEQEKVQEEVKEQVRAEEQIKAKKITSQSKLTDLQDMATQMGIQIVDKNGKRKLKAELFADIMVKK